MTEGELAELYASPGGKFIRSDSLPRILAHWRSLRSAQKLYLDELAEDLASPSTSTDTNIYLLLKPLMAGIPADVVGPWLDGRRMKG